MGRGGGGVRLGGASNNTCAKKVATFEDLDLDGLGKLIRGKVYFHHG